MKRSALKTAEVNTLVDAYRASASAHGHATETGDYKRTHREYDQITAEAVLIGRS
jgi:hypothetical protein